MNEGHRKLCQGRAGSEQLGKTRRKVERGHITQESPLRLWRRNRIQRSPWYHQWEKLVWSSISRTNPRAKEKKPSGLYSWPGLLQESNSWLVGRRRPVAPHTRLERQVSESTEMEVARMHEAEQWRGEFCRKTVLENGRGVLWSLGWKLHPRCIG